MGLENVRRKLKQRALALGVLRGTTKYAQFVILGRSRVGSNLLRGLLDAHSQVVAYGELFQDYDKIGWGTAAPTQDARALSLFQAHPQRFLEEQVFGVYPEGTKAVGFKLFYYHAQEDNRRSLWDYLRRRQHVRILHIKRANILKTYLSWTLADKTGEWVRLGEKEDRRQSVKLSYDDCLKTFRKTREWEEEFTLYFADHPTLDILYEALAADYDAEMKRVQDFLGLQYEVVRPSTRKQSQRPLSVAIANYYELKEQFSGTEWEVFFEE